jgi:hypothetical protein
MFTPSDAANVSPAGSEPPGPVESEQPAANVNSAHAAANVHLCNSIRFPL